VAALTSTGGVYLNIRHQAAHRAKAYSSTGFSGWTGYGPDHKLWDPRCFGSVAAYHDGHNPYSLIFVNCDCKTDRKNITLRISTDDGQTFPWARVVDAQRGGYAEVAADSKSGLIYVLYEDQYGITDHLLVCNYAWIREDCAK
jgi:sialidase-1